MTGIEKKFVNRRVKAARNIAKVQGRLAELDLGNIHDVLEIGCGIGIVSAWLAETYGFVVYGTDFDLEQVEIAKKMNSGSEHLHFQVENGAHLSFADASFDLVLSQNVFHHIPDWKAAVVEVARVLRKGGYFIWLDLTFPKMVKDTFQPWVKNYGLYTNDDITHQFQQCGFEPLYRESPSHFLFKHLHVVLRKN